MKETKNFSWDEWNQPYIWSDLTLHWLKTRPAVIIELILKFPPDAKVKANRTLDLPRPGEIGIVSSYFEDGTISVVVPNRDIRAQCRPEWLELVACRPGMSPKDIKERLK